MGDRPFYICRYVRDDVPCPWRGEPTHRGDECEHLRPHSHTWGCDAEDTSGDLDIYCPRCVEVEMDEQLQQKVKGYQFRCRIGFLKEG